MKRKKWTGVALCVVLGLLTACGVAGQTAENDAADMAMETGDSSKTEEAAEPGPADSDVNRTESTGSADSSGQTGMADGLPGDGTGQSDTDAVTDGEEQTAEESADAADGIPEEPETGEAAGAPEEPEAGEAAGDVSEKGIRMAAAGMKLSILGDSISTFKGWIPEGNLVFYPENGTVKDVAQTWWKIVLDELGLTLCANGSSSGSASFGYSQEADPMYGCSDHRISQLAGADGEAPDIIIVYMGTNYVLMSAAIGDNDGLQAVGEGLVGSLSDGYTMILDKIKRRYPQAQVYCCTLLPVGDWGTTEAQPFVPFVNGQNVTSEAYSERIRLIAGNRGLPIIDLEKCGITIDNMAEMTADGVHPTAEGMRLIADTVKKCLTE